jgi:hypothetical protein
MRRSTQAILAAAASSFATAPAMAQSCNPTTIVNGVMDAAQQAHGMSLFGGKLFLHEYNSQVLAGVGNAYSLSGMGRHLACHGALVALEEKALHSTNIENFVTQLKLSVALHRNPDVASLVQQCCPS